MKVKVCGITSISQLYDLVELQVQYAGLIFYPPSPRFVGRTTLNGTDVKKTNVKLYKVGVFVDATYEEVMKRIDEFGLDMVQLHGHETPYQCQKIVPFIDVIKAFRFSENDHVKWMIQDYYNSTDMFLMDTGVQSPIEGESKILYSSTRRKFNWQRLSTLNIQKPFFLSGGIEPGDIGSVKDFMKDPAAKDLIAVDINSRFESKPGIKDMQKNKKLYPGIK